MAWWQKKLLRYGLRYGLSKTGFLDDEAIDLDNLDITIGKQNIIDLRDVGLNIAKIAKLAQLPPCLRIETARILSLRLTIPADFYQSSIVAEIDGVNVIVRVEEDDSVLQRPFQPARNRSPATARTPQHRKMNRRIHSPPPHHASGACDKSDDPHIPTTAEVARSFLREEPVQERRELEASLAANTRAVDESFVSQSSDGDLGTGMGIGLPGFLSGFLQGLVDRFRVEIRNVQVRIETDSFGDLQPTDPIGLRLKVGSVELERLSTLREESPSHQPRKRTITFHEVSVDLLSSDEVLAELSDFPSRSTTTSGKSPKQSPKTTAGSMDGTNRRPSTTSTGKSFSSMDAPSIDLSMEPALPLTSSPPPLSPPAVMQASHATVDADSFADAYGDVDSEPGTRSTELDIRAGEDNISWGSRRSQASAPAEDLWKSMVSEDDLPDPLLVHPAKASILPAHSSRSTSPFATRQRRAVSPYARDIQSPGSWPRLDQSLEGHHLHHSPGSWPMLAHEHHSVYEPLAEVLTSAHDLTDNKRGALQSGHVQGTRLQTPPDLHDTVGDDLLESKVFSHEEAQSMYMSAMTGSPSMAIPGGWGSDVQSERSSSDEAAQNPVQDESHQTDQASHRDETKPSVAMLSGNITPRPPSPKIAPVPHKTSPAPIQLAVREILHIDCLSISIPSPGLDSDEGESLSGKAQSQSSVNTGDRHAGMPGTFSAYSEASSSRRQGEGSVYAEASAAIWQSLELSDAVEPPPFEVAIGLVCCQLDIPTGRILDNVAAKILPSLRPSSSHDLKTESKIPGPDAPQTSLVLQVTTLRWSLREQILAGSSLRNHSSIGDGAIDITCEKISLQKGTDSNLHCGALSLSLSGRDLLTFEKSNSSGTSLVLADDIPAVSVHVKKKRLAASRRPVTDISMQTARVQLSLDVTAVDEVFGSFGGLSGVLELGNSILSESGASSPAASKSVKGVRFAGESEQVESTPELKFNARIGGLTAVVRGTSCFAALRTSTFKAVYREQGAVATVEHIRLSAPHVGEDLIDAAIAIDLASLRVEYLIKPQDKDLERLLSLLTPSKDKYDNDDDILIDTLLRQRRKGSLLRIAIGQGKVLVHDWSCIKTLNDFANELGKLSAVTKYLPEDERPGILTLIRVKDAEAQIPVNERFGALVLATQDLHIAHVGLPALLAFSIGNIGASQLGGPEVLHSFLLSTGAENLPAVMARMLGDEEEPTIKIKLFNLCVEYKVPVFLALTGIDEEIVTEDLINAMAQSVANLTVFEKPFPPERSPGSDLFRPRTKRTTIDLLIHDSAIGLSPHKLASKAIIVLSDAHISTKVPPEDSLSARLELRKASLLIIDHFTDQALEMTLPSRTSTNNTERANHLTNALQKQGFVSVASIMSATIDFRAEESIQLESKKIEVEVKNELLLLESCADSTQTLIATLSALAPPTPPSKIPKYLSEPLMPIEDLINSFSGQTLPAAEILPQVLYDVEEDPEEVIADIPMASSIFEEADDLLAESAMTGSLYGPISSILDTDADVDNESTVGDDYPETAESLLEEDPFEMTNADDVRLRDAALLRDLGRQCQPAVDSKPIDLELVESEDLGFDAPGSGQQALGTQYRFNAPYVGSRGRGSKNKRCDMPFKLRLADFHVIWHMYDGYDWQRTREGIAEAVEQVEQRADARRSQRRRSHNDPEDEESVIGDFLFNSIYIGVPSGHDAQELRRAINRNIDEDVSETASIPVSGISRPATVFSASEQPRQRQRRRLKLGRSKNHKIAFEFKGVSADVLVYPASSGETVSSVDLRIKDFEIFDKVPSSTWRKFLTHMTNDPSAREMAKPMFHIRLDNVKTLQSHSASEIRLHVTVLPLRLHVDQDALDFITRFFEFKDEASASTGPDSEKPFIQRVEVDTVDMCLDYKPKTIDFAGLRSGKTTEFMNIITLEAANIRLKHAIAYGVKSFDDLHPTLNDIWMPDIKRNQLPTILAGLAPVRSLVNIGAGVRDVVAIPIREYKKDGRIVRSIQKGAFHFGKTTTSELARLGAKVALGTQTLLTNAEEFLSPSESSSGRPGAGHRIPSDQGWHDVASDDDDPDHKRAVSAYANQPLGLLSGLRSARRYLEHDLLTARDALIAVQGEYLESRGTREAASAIGRHAPTVILRPVIGGMRAVGTTLLGVGNQIDREALRKVEDKYKRR